MLEIDINSIEWYVWALCALFLIGFLVQIFYYLYFYAGILYQKRKIRKGDIEYSNDNKGISVIICAYNESENLREFLPSVLKQKYPTFEVIVVNIGQSDETEDLLNNLSKQYPNLYATYIPQNAQMISMRKLALTIAEKAAKYDCFLFTEANCEPVSENWIQNMARNFTDKTDFVLGYTANPKGIDFVSRLISFDGFFAALQYMGFALRRKPFTASEGNMAYRKQIFFDHKGFATMLHLRLGDNELLFNKTATKTNVNIEIAPESTIVAHDVATFNTWYLKKERRLSTFKQYNAKSRFLVQAELFSRLSFYLPLIGLAIFARPIIIYSALLGFLLRYTTQAIVINKSARHFKESKFYFSIFAFDILLPLISLSILINNAFRRSKYKN